VGLIKSTLKDRPRLPRFMETTRFVEEGDMEYMNDGIQQEYIHEAEWGPGKEAAVDDVMNEEMD
jgi:hypothetical protein